MGSRQRSTVVVAVAITLALVSCRTARSPEPAPGPEWALAVHGGAGTFSSGLTPEEEAGYFAGLENALAAGSQVLAAGGSALDAVERAVIVLEDDPLFNAGRGAVFNREGGHELDAAVMVGEGRRCGAVAGVRTVRHPVSLARAVMESTPHVLLVGIGAERLAERQGLEVVDPAFFDTETRRRQLEKALREPAGGTGTVGAVARDRRGHLAAATSTGGTMAKLAGRVGDVPIIGSGTWADDRTCAISATGKGEEFIRHGVAHEIDALMRLRGLPLDRAAREVIHGLLSPGDGGIIAVDRHGRLVAEFNSQGMLRGFADADGRLQVGVWAGWRQPADATRAATINGRASSP